MSTDPAVTRLQHSQAHRLQILSAASDVARLAFFLSFAVVLSLAFGRAMFTRADGIYTGVLNNVGALPFHRSEEHTSELQSHSFISYAVFCLKKQTTYPGPTWTPPHLPAAPTLRLRQSA